MELLRMRRRKRLRCRRKVNHAEVDKGKGELQYVDDFV